MSESYAKELEIGCLSVQRAAILTKRILSSVDKGALEKDDLSPVTIGDFAAQALLISALHHSFPADNFVGEESADALRENPKLLQRVWDLVRTTKLDHDESEAKLKTPSSIEELLEVIDLGGKGQGGAEGRIWVLDPIDGTATFMRGEQYAINLALLVDGKQQLAVLGCPVLDLSAQIVEEKSITTSGGCLFSAVKGQGAFKRPLTTAALQDASPIPRLAEIVEPSAISFADCTTTSSTVLQYHKEVCKRLGAAFPPKSDLWSSLMKYAALALGGSNVCIRIFKRRAYHSCIWDHAGGHLIFEECGGKITDIDGNDIDFSKGRRLFANYGLVCAPSNLHGLVLNTVRAVIAEKQPSLLNTDSV